MELTRQEVFDLIDGIESAQDILRRASNEDLVGKYAKDQLLRMQSLYDRLYEELDKVKN